MVKWGYTKIIDAGEYYSIYNIIAIISYTEY